MPDSHHQVNYPTLNSKEEKVVNLMSNKHGTPNFVANVTLRQLLGSAALGWLLGKAVSAWATKMISRILGKNHAPESWRIFTIANKVNK